jgi:hypothetical protein
MKSFKDFLLNETNAIKIPDDSLIAKNWICADQILASKHGMDEFREWSKKNKSEHPYFDSFIQVRADPYSKMT